MPEITNFQGKAVVGYAPGMTLEPDKFTYRVGVSWDAEDLTMDDLWQSFVAQERVEEVTALVIGAWELEQDELIDEFLEVFLPTTIKLPNLTHLFFGDIEPEESEISWIVSSNLAPVIHAFPNLVDFGCRAGEGLRFEALSHPKLESLRVETGGLAKVTLEDIISADLPNLNALHLWLGDSGYGFDGDIDTVRPLMYGRKYPESGYMFPELKSLGLMNSDIADGVANALLGAPVLEQLESLDLSMGIMSDRGARALAENPKIASLKTLSLSSNHIGDEDLFDQIASLGVVVENSGQKEAGDYFYVDVAE